MNHCKQCQYIKCKYLAREPMDMLGEARETIAALQAKLQEREWRTESPPTEEGSYIVSKRHPLGDTVEECYWSGRWAHGGELVAAWQPLPDPYKGMSMVNRNEAGEHLRQTCERLRREEEVGGDWYWGEMDFTNRHGPHATRPAAIKDARERLRIVFGKLPECIMVGRYNRAWTREYLAAE